MRNLFLLIIVFFLLFDFQFSYSQALQDTSYYRIETTDGNTFIGRIVDEDPEVIVFQTDNIGQITITKRNIKSRTLIDPNKIKDGNFWFDNPQATRYFWQPNGYGLNQGEGYYQNVWILLNQVSVGITENFSMGLGLVPLFFFGGTSTPVWITPKFSIPVVKEKFNLGAGALLGTVLGEGEAGFGVLYGISTFGSRDKNLSIGLGWAYTGEGGLANTPTISLGGMIRTGAKGYFLTENYYIGMGAGSSLTIISLGGRQIIRKVGLDYGALLPISPDIGTFILIPWLGLTVPFGNVPDAKNR